MIGQSELAANHVCCAAKFLLPEAVADHDSRRATAANVVAGIQNAANKRPDAQHIKELAAHPKRSSVANFPALGQIKVAGTPGEDSGESLLSISQLFPEWISKRVVPIAVAATPGSRIYQTDLHELVRRPDGKLFQANRIEQLKNCRVCSDAERQTNYGRKREPRSLAQYAARKT